jgi:hypothetical protein
VSFSDQVAISVQAYLDKHAPLAVYQRGAKYYAQNRATFHGKMPSGIGYRFKVIGNELYDVYVQFVNPTLDEVQYSICECMAAMNGVCKHQVAALLWCAEHCEEENPNLEQQTVGGLSANGATSTSQNGADSPAGLRNADTFYTVTSYAEGVEHLRPFDVGSDDQKSFQGTIRDVQHPGSGKVEMSYIVHQERLHYRTQVFLISIQFHEGGLDIACDCGSKVAQVCGHGFMALSILHEHGYLAKWEPWMQAKKNEKGIQEMQNFGFEPVSEWQQYFDYSHTGKGHFFILKPDYQTFLAPAKINAGLIESIETSHPARELAKLGKLEEKKGDPYQLGFAFLIDDEAESNRAYLIPFGAKPSSKGEPMSRSFMLKSRISHNSEIKYNAGDFDILYAANNSELSSEGYGKQKMTLVEAIASIATKLERHPHIYLSDGRIHGGINKKNMVPATFLVGAPEIFIEIGEQKDFYALEVFISGQEGPKAISTLKLQAKHPHFLVVENVVHFIESARQWAALNAAVQLHHTRISHSKIEETFEKFLGKLGEQIELKFKNMKNLTQGKPDTAVPLSKEVYLSEVGNFIIFEPFVRYSKDVLVPAAHSGSRWKVKKGSIKAQKLNKEAGQRLIDELKAAHPSFAEQRRSDFFHVTYKDLLQTEVAMGVFEKLNEADIKVFGEHKLTRLSELPRKAKISYAVKSNTDWFEVKASFSYGDEMLSLASLKKRFVPGRDYVELSNGGRGLLPQNWLRRLERLFKMGELQEDGVSVSTVHFNLIDELFADLEQPDLQAFIAERREKLLHFKGIETHKLPTGIKAKLRAYQKDGFQWLCFLHEFGWGGILADDMGLGKTLQVITFLKHVLQTNKQVSLVVVPTSLLFNWENELQKFAPSIKVHFHHGTGRSTDQKEIEANQLVVTTYGTMLSDIDFLRHIKFNYVVLDESQAIKNAASKRYKAVRLLKANNRLAMTGTPIENNTFDLYAQLSFLNPGLLGTSAQFKADFAKAIDTHRDAEKAALLQRMIKPFVLRRTKEQVAKELPDKVEDVLYCELGAAQRKVYDAHRNEIRETLLGNMESEAVTNVRFAVLQGLTKLRQICDSPLLLPGKQKYVGGSEKIDLLVRHIREKTANHKLLIFSQFVKMLKLIEDRVVSEKIPHAYLDGKSTPKARQEAVDTFQNDPDCRVFLISIKAGGTGLNLMAADYVYIVDPWWNPAVENQAIDRCYRIGQDKKVIAYRMICKDTVEEKIQKLQARKKSIANELITTDEGVMQKLSKDDLIDLFG